MFNGIDRKFIQINFSIFQFGKNLRRENSYKHKNSLLLTRDCTGVANKNAFSSSHGPLDHSKDALAVTHLMNEPWDTSKSSNLINIHE